MEKYKGTNNVRFVALSSGRVSRLENFLRRIKFNFEQKMLTHKTLRIGGVPTTLICYQNGVVQYVIRGGSGYMYKYIDRIISTLLDGGILTL